jgi:branched-chain amino acid transport system ATP-binding protein
MTGAALVARGLSRRFGGLRAVHGVSLDLYQGEVHALIGPNGAGKTTLTNILSGELAPDAGSIRFEGHELAGLPPQRIARLGIARSFQQTNIFSALTVFENCRLAAQAREPHAWSILSNARSFPRTERRARDAVALAGLAGREEVTAGSLSHGEQRQLEIALCLATGPRVLLLDEPLAGMGAEESDAMVRLIARLRPDHAILLVEHDMDAVFAVADRITVMVSGEALACGTPQEIRASKAVQEAYLGDGEGSADA